MIQAYWGAEVNSIEAAKKITPEKYLEHAPEIHLCDIIIDGKCVGTISWDGKKLGIFEWANTPQEDYHKALLKGFLEE